MIYRNSRHIAKNQDGMAAIVVSVILMVVITLITLSFSQIIRREQRSALDYQLATQAYYAAESGVNMAQKKIQDAVTSGSAIPTKTTCPENSVFTATDYAINDTTKITCLLVESEVFSQHFTDVSMQPVVAHMERSDGQPVTNVSISWEISEAPTSPPAGCTSTTALPAASPSDTWNCDHPLVRVDIVPTGGNFRQSDLLSNQVSAFLYPTRTGSAPTVINATTGAATGSRLGEKVAVRCNTTNQPYACTANLTLPGSDSYAIRALSLYGDSNIDMSVPGVGGQPERLTGGQVSIDSTARSVDVLRRVQVRVSPFDRAVPFGIVSAAGFCKLYSLSPTQVRDDCSGEVVNRPVALACSEPHDIVLVLDVSSSMDGGYDTASFTKRQKMISVAKDFVDTTGVANDKNRIGVVSFWGQAATNISFSGNADDVKNAIDGMFNGGTGTSYIAGLTNARTMLENNTRPSVKRVVVFLSDGVPNTGETDAEISVIAQDIKNRLATIVYAVGVKDVGPAADTMKLVASNPDTDYYTTAATERNFDDFFADVRSDVTCP